MLPVNLLILSEPKWVDVCDSRSSLCLVLVPWCHGAVVFLVHSGIGCLSPCLAHRCCRSPSQVSRGAHENAVPCENSMAMRIVGLVVLCAPRELDSVARYRTDFELLCSMPLRNVFKRFISGLAHENVLCVQVRSVYLSEVEDWSFNHRVTPIT